jgi:hypothetical protein
MDVLFRVRGGAKQGKDGLDEFWMLVAEIIFPTTDDWDKIFHATGLSNGQNDCEINWLFMVITITDQSLTYITNG